MVFMVVGGEDMGELPAPLFQVIGDGVCVGRINGDGRAGAGVVDKNAKVVAAADELVNLKMGHGHDAIPCFPLCEPVLLLFLRRSPM